MWRVGCLPGLRDPFVKPPGVHGQVFRDTKLIVKDVLNGCIVVWASVFPLSLMIALTAVVTLMVPVALIDLMVATVLQEGLEPVCT